MKQLIKHNVRKCVQNNYFAIPAIQHNQTGMVDILSEEVGRKNKISFEKMTSIVCEYFNTNMQEVISRNRKKNIVSARHTIIFIGVDILTTQHPTYDKTRIYRLIADKLNRDRTSVIYTHAKLSWLSKKDIFFKKEFQELKYLL